MPPTPIWPENTGPRILTMVGNDVTIDVRARKTASSLSRAGFSVIAMGVDEVGAAPTQEDFGGATIWRVTPSPDPRISPRMFRWSRNELRDAWRYRSDILRSKLALSRRYLNSEEFEPALREHTQSGSLDSTRTASISARARIFLLRIRYVLSSNTYKLLARPSSFTIGKGKWERDLPEMHRYEHSLAPLVDILEPDLIHVHDVFHIGLAVRAKRRSFQKGRAVKVVYDAHEYVAGLPLDKRRVSALSDLEARYVGDVDSVVTVSEHMADAINTRYGVRPVVVLNAPDAETAIDTEPLRSVVGLPDSAVLIVYVGGVAPSRGAEELIDAIPLLPSHFNLVFVAGPVTGYIAKLEEMARTNGVGDRVHFAPFVAPEAVISYIRSSDVSIIPLSRSIKNYEVTLPNKLFQSIHAGVPVVVSDNPAMAEFVSRYPVGEIFRGGDLQDLVSAIKLVVENPDRYRSGLTDDVFLESLTWKAQMRCLVEEYAALGIEKS